MPDREREGLPVAPIAIGAGLGLSPFAGMIGEGRITKDPYFNKNIKRVSPEALEQLARAGDVILGSHRGDSGKMRYKMPQLFNAGTEFFHAEPVIGSEVRNLSDPETGKTIRGKRQAYTIDTGRMDYSGRGRAMKELQDEAINTRFVSEKGRRIPLQDYEDMVLLRRKGGKKLSKAEVKQLQEIMIRGGGLPYSSGLGNRAWLRDIFIPKIPWLTNLGNSPKIECRGNMCASLPSSGMTELTGENVIKGKHPKHVLPADFLRSNSSFEPVAATLQNPEPMKRLLAKRLALRAGMGLGLGGAGLAAYHDPALIPAAAGAVALPVGVRALIDYANRKSLVGEKSQLKKRLIRALRSKNKREAASRAITPTMYAATNIPDLINQLRTKPLRAGQPRVSPAMKSLYKKWSTRTLPLGLGGGLAAYLAAKGIGNYFSD